MNDIVGKICRTCKKAKITLIKGIEVNKCPGVNRQIFKMSNGDYCPEEEENKDLYIKIRVNDDTGEHVLDSSEDCVWVCRSCRSERRITKDDVICAEGTPSAVKEIKAPICHCGQKMKFNYWLDRFIDEESC